MPIVENNVNGKAHEMGVHSAGAWQDESGIVRELRPTHQTFEAGPRPWASFKGLMGRAELANDAGLVLPGARGVHTHFMRFPIDVVFYDRHCAVVGLEHALRPWRFSAYHL